MFLSNLYKSCLFIYFKLAVEPGIARIYILGYNMWLQIPQSSQSWTINHLSSTITIHIYCADLYCLYSWSILPILCWSCADLHLLCWLCWSILCDYCLTSIVLLLFTIIKFEGDKHTETSFYLYRFNIHYDIDECCSSTMATMVAH